MIFSSHFPDFLQEDLEFSLKRLNVHFIFIKVILYDHLIDSRKIVYRQKKQVVYKV